MINPNKSELVRLCREVFSPLPEWEELPSIGLYMDQVTELTNSYTAGPYGLEITRPMINNYVKLKMMPAPEKKKYTRVHIAYIMIICILKQTLNISTIQKFLPSDAPAEEVEKIYTAFAENQKKALCNVCTQLENAAEQNAAEDSSDLMMQIASTANILKRLTEAAVNGDEQ